MNDTKIQERHTNLRDPHLLNDTLLSAYLKNLGCHSSTRTVVFKNSIVYASKAHRGGFCHVLRVTQALWWRQLKANSYSDHINSRLWRAWFFHSRIQRSWFAAENEMMLSLVVLALFARKLCYRLSSLGIWLGLVRHSWLNKAILDRSFNHRELSFGSVRKAFTIFCISSVNLSSHLLYDSNRLYHMYYREFW